MPLNPIKIMLSAGATFVARIYAEVAQVKMILEEAKKHKGFAFIEIMQPCTVFHIDSSHKKRVYNLQQSGHEKKDLKAAMEKADEYDYNSKTSKIPLGIFYQTQRETFEELKLKKIYKQNKTN